MEKIYIGLVDTPGFFAFLIRKTIQLDYIHVVLSLDAELRECYSIGRRFPSLPLLAGFEKEETHKILRAFPDARYQVFTLECTRQQKQQLKKQLEACYENRYKYHYCIAGLPFILMNRPFYQKRHYTCSSFIAHILEENGIHLFQKHFSLVTPKDFYNLKEKEVIYEGRLRNMGREKRCSVVPKTA